MKYNILVKIMFAIRTREYYNRISHFETECKGQAFNWFQRALTLQIKSESW